jgi:hypothetical protein
MDKGRVEIKLYKIIDGKIVLSDYGVLSKIDCYTKQGYIVKINYKSESEENK